MLVADFQPSHLAEHLTVLESDLADRNSLIKHTQDENKALREEVMEREFSLSL